LTDETARAAADAAYANAGANRPNDGQTWPNVRPKTAATLIVLDRSGKQPKVLMGKRHADIKFMPGKFVFPGGRLERADHAMLVAGALPSHVEDRLIAKDPDGSAAKARAMALAAIRETFEETGLMIGTKDYGAPPRPPAGAWAEFAAHGVFPSLEGFHFIARAITPPRMSKRFDARFFCVDAQWIAHRVEGKTGPEAELTELVWIPLAETAQLDLAEITRTILSELQNRIAGRMAPYIPVPLLLEKNRKWQRVEL